MWPHLHTANRCCRRRALVQECWASTFTKRRSQKRERRRNWHQKNRHQSCSGSTREHYLSPGSLSWGVALAEMDLSTSPIIKGLQLSQPLRHHWLRWVSTYRNPFLPCPFLHPFPLPHTLSFLPPSFPSLTPSPPSFSPSPPPPSLPSSLPSLQLDCVCCHGHRLTKHSLIAQKKMNQCSYSLDWAKPHTRALPVFHHFILKRNFKVQLWMANWSGDRARLDFVYLWRCSLVRLLSNYAQNVTKLPNISIAGFSSFPYLTAMCLHIVEYFTS